jgi:6-phosphogluconolactonase
MKNPMLYVGTYTRQYATQPAGIYQYELDMATGALHLLSSIDGGENPSYLTFDLQRRFLYAVNETMQWNDQPGGAVSALAIDAQTGRLTRLNQQASLGGLPCYISVDAERHYAYIANYMSGNVCIYPIEADGRLSAASDMIQHQGSSANPSRQKGPHAHSIVIDPTNRFALVPDLGIDKVMIYQIDDARGKLVKHSEAKVQPGAGPRHLTFHPNGRFAYLINEVNNTLTTFAYDAAGELHELQTLPTLPPDFTGESTAADIHVTPSGKFVYGTNRGHDSLVMYAIDAQKGTLSLVGHVSTGGRTPRNFAIDPSGAYLLAANQDSNNIVTFRIDAESGKLQANGQVAEAPSPVCIRFLA